MSVDVDEPLAPLKLLSVTWRLFREGRVFWGLFIKSRRSTVMNPQQLERPHQGPPLLHHLRPFCPITSFVRSSLWRATLDHAVACAWLVDCH